MVLAAAQAVAVWSTVNWLAQREASSCDPIGRTSESNARPVDGRLHALHRPALGNVLKLTELNMIDSSSLIFDAETSRIGEMVMAEQFKPGDKVPRSGIYRVTHDTMHGRTPHEVTCVHGHRFPPCNHCGNHPRFELVRFAKHISNDEDFTK